MMLNRETRELLDEMIDPDLPDYDAVILAMDRQAQQMVSAYCIGREEVAALKKRLDAAVLVIAEARTIKAVYFLDEPLMHGDQNHRDWLTCEVNHAFGSLENLIALYDEAAKPC